MLLEGGGRVILLVMEGIWNTSLITKNKVASQLARPMAI